MVMTNAIYETLSKSLNNENYKILGSNALDFQKNLVGIK